MQLKKKKNEHLYPFRVIQALIRLSSLQWFLDALSKSQKSDYKLRHVRLHVRVD